MPELLRAEALVHRFPDGTTGLQGIDLSLSDGEFMVLAGRNGSGKTLLARHFVGLSTPSSGRVLYRGVPVGSDLGTVRKAVGYVFQDTEAQILGQTVAEDLAFGPANLRLGRAGIAERTAEALAMARLGGMEQRRPETLSGGEKRRLAIAGILAMRPECLILDEPFANLDLESVRDVLRVCIDARAAGRTLVVLTHELEKVLPLATRLVVMSGGRIVYDGEPANPDPEFYGRHGLANPFGPVAWAPGIDSGAAALVGGATGEPAASKAPGAALA